MINSELVQKVKDKIDRLKRQWWDFRYLPSEKYATDIIQIDHIKIEKNLISNGEKSTWEDFVYISMQRNPILSWEDAKEVREYVLWEVKNLYEKYLSE